MSSKHRHFKRCRGHSFSYTGSRLMKSQTEATCCVWLQWLLRTVNSSSRVLWSNDPTLACGEQTGDVSSNCFFEAYLLKTTDDQWKAWWSLLICKSEWHNARIVWSKLTRQESCRKRDRCPVPRPGLRLRSMFAARVDIVTVSTGVVPHQWQTIQLLNRCVRH